MSGDHLKAGGSIVLNIKIELQSEMKQVLR